MVRTSFKFLAFQTNLGNKLGSNLLKNSNERELSFFTYCRYFFILLKSITIYAIKRKEDTRLIKKVVDIEKKIQENSKDCNRFHSKNLKRSVPESFL